MKAERRLPLKENATDRVYGNHPKTAPDPIRSTPMKVLRSLALFLLPSLFPPAMAAPLTIELPPPQLKGGGSLPEALQARRSVRSYSKAPVTLEEVAQLAWAARDGGLQTVKHLVGESSVDVNFSFWHRSAGLLGAEQAGHSEPFCLSRERILTATERGGHGSTPCNTPRRASSRHWSPDRINGP